MGWRPVNSMVRSAPMEAYAMGKVLHEDDKHIVVLPFWTADNEGDADLTIPRDWLIEVIDLVPAPKRRRKR